MCACERRVVLKTQSMGARYKAGPGVSSFAAPYPTHTLVGKASTLPPPPPQLDSAKGVGARDGKVAVPTLELRGRQDFSWPLLLNLCPARCYVPTYFTSIKN